MATFAPPQHVLDSLERRWQGEASRVDRPCGEGTAGGTCGKRPTLPMPRGWRCRAHRPAVPVPDPTRTLAALQLRMRAPQEA